MEYRANLELELGRIHNNNNNNNNSIDLEDIKRKRLFTCEEEEEEISLIESEIEQIQARINNLIFRSSAN